MNAIARMAAIAAAAVCVAGCSPEELEIAIPTSAVGKAANGSCGMAAATVVFKADQKSVTEKFPQIAGRLRQPSPDSLWQGWRCTATSSSSSRQRGLAR